MQTKVMLINYFMLVISIATICDRLIVQAGCSAAASASAAAVSAGSGDSMVPLEYEVDNVEAVKEVIEILKGNLINEIEAHPDLYDQQDADAFLSGTGALSAIRFYNQRSGDWVRAYKSAVNALRWRKTMGLSYLTAAHFPCDLFQLGLIFEHGRSRYLDTATGEYMEGNPVIWIRLGALGSVVRYLESFTPQRVVSFAYNSARKAVKTSQNIVDRIRTRPTIRVQRDPSLVNLSIDTNETIKYVLKSMAWWLDNWVNTHPQDARATLVLDFENTDFAFSSWTMGEFFVKLDDHFPDLFEKIIGFRYKPKLWSLHSKISMFIRIFKSRISSSPETDSKIEFVRSERGISRYMSRVDVNGLSTLPEHVYGTCTGPIQAPPVGCQADPLALEGALDPNMWQAIYNEFYQLCRPKSRLSA